MEVLECTTCGTILKHREEQYCDLHECGYPLCEKCYNETVCHLCGRSICGRCETDCEGEVACVDCCLVCDLCNAVHPELTMQPCDGCANVVCCDCSTTSSIDTLCDTCSAAEIKRIQESRARFYDLVNKRTRATLQKRAEAKRPEEWRAKATVLRKAGVERAKESRTRFYAAIDRRTRPPEPPIAKPENQEERLEKMR